MVFEKLRKDPNKHSTYFIDLTIYINYLDTDYPVTEGLSDFTMNDAYYENIYMDPEVHPLRGLNIQTSRTRSPGHKSMIVLGWSI